MLKKEIGVGSQMRFGVIGVGAIGRVHAENLAKNIPGASLVGIADAVLDVANEVGRRLGVAKVYPDYHELLEQESVDAIVVATPPFVKREIVLAAAKNGKHVFLEKPMCLDLKEADEMIQASSRSGVKLQIGYQRRFDRAFVNAEKAISSDELGKILLVRSHTRDPPGNPGGWTIDPKLSGGIMLDTCSHDFDIVRFLTRSEVRSVFAAGANLVYPQLATHGEFDNVVVVMKLESGALAYSDSCQYTVYGYDVGAEVLGTKAAIRIGIGDESPLRILGKGSDSSDYPQTFQERFGGAYRDELIEFMDCVSKDRQPKVAGKDGRAAIEIGIAARQSMKTNEPVTLPLN
jgi:predicted dehydrogenase